MSLRTAPCDWPLAHCGEPVTGEVSCAALDALDPALAEMIEEAAVSYLWNWTGQKFGLCSVTIRPCRETCLDWNTTYRGNGRGTGYPGLPWYGGDGLSPALIGGQWFNLPCGGSCAGSCSCGPVEQIDLGSGVDSVTSVMLDGVELSASAYRLDNNRYLVRTDGGTWPDCQDMSADPSTPGSNTFAVTYASGVPVPAGGQLAAGVLACQLAKAACGDAACKLPQRVQRVSRQGVELLFDDMSTLWTQGGTGLWIVDSWIASVNVSKRGGRVASPDFRPVRRTT